MVFKLRALYEKQNLITATSKKCQNDIKTMGYKRPSKLKCATGKNMQHHFKKCGYSLSYSGKPWFCIVNFTDNPKLLTTEAGGVSEKPFSSIVLNTDGLLKQESAFSNQRFNITYFLKLNLFKKKKQFMPWNSWLFMHIMMCLTLSCLATNMLNIGPAV